MGGSGEFGEIWKLCRYENVNSWKSTSVDFVKGTEGYSSLWLVRIGKEDAC